MTLSTLINGKQRVADIQVNSQMARKSRFFAMRMIFLAVAAVLCTLVPQPAKAAPTFISCTPDQVMVFSSAGGGRLHVHCAASVGGISYFALSSSDTAASARVLSVIDSAIISGRTLTVLYDPADLSGSVIGCLNTDCRLILAVGFQR
jgi:hypothetical protein